MLLVTVCQDLPDSASAPGRNLDTHEVDGIWGTEYAPVIWTPTFFLRTWNLDTHYLGGIWTPT